MTLLPPPFRHIRTLTIRSIESGNDATVSPVRLLWKHRVDECDDVTYRLAVGAAKRYRFDPENPVSFEIGGISRPDAIQFERQDDRLVVRINPAVTDWQEGKATFHFLPIGTTRQPPPFDPTISNGGPRV